MKIKAGFVEVSRDANIKNATVSLESGDTISVAYTDPNGKPHILNITAQHLVLIVVHEQTDAAMIMRPSVGVQFNQPSK